MSRFFPYLGGKHQLARRIIERLPGHQIYCEVFGGSGAVLLAKSKSPTEIFNDINHDVINLFRVVKNHAEEFMREIRWFLRSRRQFCQYKEMPPELLTDIQRAARFYYLMRTAYAGKLPAKSSFSGGGGGRKTLSIYRIEEGLYEIHQRLEDVIIEQLSWEKCLERYDKEEALFFLDPPYFGCETDYGKAVFAREDFSRMAEMLGALKGKFIVTLNDAPEIRAMFAAYPLDVEKVKYSVSGKPQEANQLIIRNFS